jgi:hypothetical protein
MVRSLLCISQVWYLAGTLVLANTIAAVVVVLVAALILPTHATEEVRPTYIPLVTFLKQLHRYCALLRASTTIVPSTQQVHGEWYTDGCHQQSLYNTAPLKDCFCWLYVWYCRSRQA